MSRRVATVAVATALALAAAVTTTAGSAAAATREVTIFAPYRGTDAQHFLTDLDAWASAHDISIRYTGTGNLAADLQFRVTNADPPDIALVPQPGLVAELARSGKVRALDPAVERTVQRNLGTAAQSLGLVDGIAVGFPYRVNLKGLVWYRPEQLAALDVTPPATLADLERMVAKIAASGLTPWCFGIEAQRATGWAATDWVENLVVREWGPEVYLDWVDGTIPFHDPRIQSSFEHFRALVLAPGRLAGGVSRAIATPVATASAPLFADPPRCALYQQASFALGWFPSGQTVARRGTLDFFVLPSTDAGASPLVVGTDVVVAFRDRPEVDAVMKYLATPAAARSWAAAGGFLSPQLALPATAYTQEADRAVVAEIQHADTLVVDGSDAMAPAVGSDLFLDRITKWMAGAITYDQLATDLDAART
jgi:alpha-glucoside transport system substrate-binding protein